MSFIECWNCGEKGHFRSKCPKPRKLTTDPKKLAEVNSNPKADSGSRTASTVEEMSDKEGAWAAYEIMDEVVSDKDWFEEATNEDDDMLELEEVSDSKDEGDGAMPDLVELIDSEDDEGCLVEVMEVLVAVEGVNDDKAKAINNTSGEAFISTESVLGTGTAELYDSGCTNHISPCKSQFQNFKDITPRHFCAANKQSFSTVGKGDMVIDVPNGPETSQLCLTDVLYSPEVNYMLVSIGCLDESSFTITFSGGKCILCGLDGVKVGEVLRKSSRVYKVEHEEEMAGAPEEKLTLEQFHH